jgi:hypothetical protein
VCNPREIFSVIMEGFSLYEVKHLVFAVLVNFFVDHVNALITTIVLHMLQSLNQRAVLLEMLATVMPRLSTRY